MCRHSEGTFKGFIEEAVCKRLDEIILSLENFNEYADAIKTFDGYLAKIRKLLPEKDQGMVIELDDFIANLMILCTRYGYVHGFYDALKLPEIFRHESDVAKC